MSCPSLRGIRPSCAKTRAGHVNRQRGTKFPSPISVSMSSAAQCRLQGRSWTPSFPGPCMLAQPGEPLGQREGRRAGQPGRPGGTNWVRHCFDATALRSKEKRGQRDMAVLPVQGFGPHSRTAVQGPAGTPGSSAEGAERHQVGPWPSCFIVTSALLCGDGAGRSPFTSSTGSPFQRASTPVAPSSNCCGPPGPEMTIKDIHLQRVLHSPVNVHKQAHSQLCY